MKFLAYIFLGTTLFLTLSGCSASAPQAVEIKVNKAKEAKTDGVNLRVITHERDADAEGNLAIGLYNLALYAQKKGYNYFSFNNKPIENKSGMPITNAKDLMRYCWPQDFEQGDDFYEHKCQRKSKKNSNYINVFKTGYSKGYRHTYTYSATLYQQKQYLFPTWSVKAVLNDEFLEGELKKAKDRAGIVGREKIILKEDLI